MGKEPQKFWNELKKLRVNMRSDCQKWKKQTNCLNKAK